MCINIEPSYLDRSCQGFFLLFSIHYLSFDFCMCFVFERISSPILSLWDLSVMSNLERFFLLGNDFLNYTVLSSVFYDFVFHI